MKGEKDTSLTMLIRVQMNERCLGLEIIAWLQITCQVDVSEIEFAMDLW